MADCCYTDSFLLSVTNQAFYAKCHYAECRYAKCHYAECHYAKCLYAEFRGAKITRLGITVPYID